MNNQQFVPNGRVNFVNPNHPNFAPAQPAQHQQQQQQQYATEAFNNYLQNGRPQIPNSINNNFANNNNPQQQAASTSDNKNKRRSRRRDVLDLGVKERGDKRGNKKRKNTAMENGRASQSETINEKRSKRINRANDDNYDHIAQDMAEMTGRLNSLSKKSKDSKPSLSDLFLGNFTDVLDDQDQVGAFKKSLFRICPGNSMIITAQSYELPKEAIGDDRKIRHIFIKYSIGWFDALKQQVWNEKNPNLNVPVQNMTDEQLLAVEKEVTTVDMFNKISEITELQYQNVLAHYKPRGLIYTIIDAGSLTDSIIAAHCNIKKYPIIQVRHEGQQDFSEIKDKKKRAAAFGTLIGNVSRYNNKYLREEFVEDKKIVPGKIFDMGKL